MMNDIQWFTRKSQTAVMDHEISEVEKLWNIVFPSDYREIAKQYHGGTPRNKRTLHIGNRVEAMGYLLSFSKENKSLYIVDTYNGIKDRLVDGIFPFADDPFGNHYCFDYRKSNNSPIVVFWDHEEAYENPETGILYLCDSFTDFLNHIEEDKD